MRIRGGAGEVGLAIQLLFESSYDWRFWTPLLLRSLKYSHHSFNANAVYFASLSEDQVEGREAV